MYGERKKFHDMRFTEKLSHIWFYHKWHILCGLAFLVMILISLAQCMGKSEPDVMLLYVGDRYMPIEYVRSFNASLEDIMTEDMNGDGIKSVDILQIRLDMVEKSDGTKEIYNPQEQTETLQRIEVETSTGQATIYIMEPTLYESYRFLAAPLSDVLGYTPEGAIDEYGILLSSLDAYKKTYLGSFPENTVIFIREKRTEGNLFTKKDSDSKYEAAENFFRELVEWQGDGGNSEDNGGNTETEAN